MSQATDAAAVLTAINAQFSTKRAYELGDPALASLTVDHILVQVSRRYVAERRASGEVTMPGHYVAVRYIAKSPANLALLREKTTVALEDRILPGDVGPFSFESSKVEGVDEGWLVEADTFTY